MADDWCLCQVVVSNSLAALSGSSVGRIYCDNLNVSACPLTEASKKVTRIQAHSCTHARAHRWHARTHLRWNIRFFTSYSIFGFSCVISFSVPVSLSQFSVNVYNSLARPVVWPVRLPVNASAYTVLDATGAPVDCQVSVCVFQTTAC